MAREKLKLTDDMDPVARVRQVREEMAREFPTVESLAAHLDRLERNDKRRAAASATRHIGKRPTRKTASRPSPQRSRSSR